MANILREYRTEKLNFPVDGYKWNVQVWISVDGGKSYAYCGIGKFCKTEQECAEYIEKYKAEHGEE